LNNYGPGFYTENQKSSKAVFAGGWGERAESSLWILSLFVYSSTKILFEM